MFQNIPDDNLKFISFWELPAFYIHDKKFSVLLLTSSTKENADFSFYVDHVVFKLEKTSWKSTW